MTQKVIYALLLGLWIGFLCVPLSAQDRGEPIEDFDLDELKQEEDSLLGTGPDAVGLLYLFEIAHLRIDMGFNMLSPGSEIDYNAGDRPGIVSENVKLRPLASRNMQIAFLFAPSFFKKRLALHIGPALGTDKYSFRDSTYLLHTHPVTRVVKNSDLIGSGTPLSSMFRNVYIGLPMEWVLYPTPKRRRGLHIAAGAYLRYVIASQTRIRYRAHDKLHKVKLKAPYAIEPLQFGLSGRIGYGRVFSLFYRLPLVTPLFDEVYGPDSQYGRKTHSIGISIGYN